MGSPLDVLSAGEASAGPRTLAEKAFESLHQAIITGRLRPATQPARRLEECLKFGIREVLAPAGTGAGSREVDTVRRALAGGLSEKTV